MGGMMGVEHDVVKSDLEESAERNDVELSMFIEELIVEHLGRLLGESLSLGDISLRQAYGFMSILSRLLGDCDVQG